MFKRFKYL